MKSCPPVCRVLVEAKPNHGAWNMAVDEALLEAALDCGQSAVRIYKWSRATISLGYFQDTITRPSVPGADDLPVVRRLSGGGAILHEHELTYSCIVAPQHSKSQLPAEIYDLVHQAVIAILSRHGIDARMRGSRRQLPVEPFLCFGRSNPHDVVFKNHKILGRAQRRRRGAILQHGSLLLMQSEWAPQFLGIQDLVPNFRLDGSIERQLACEIGAVFGQAQIVNGLSDRVRANAVELANHKYHTIDWNQRE